jgi:hypothetical protein
MNTCLMKHAETLLRTKDCCTHSLLRAQQDALTHNKNMYIYLFLFYIKFLIVIFEPCSKFSSHLLTLRPGALYESGQILKIQFFFYIWSARFISISLAYIGTSGRGEVASLVPLFSIHVPKLYKRKHGLCD